MAGRGKAGWVAVGALLVLVAGEAKAVAAPDRTATADAYVLRMRAVAVDPGIDAPYSLVPGVGYSAVNLIKRHAERDGDCEAIGAGAYKFGPLDGREPGDFGGPLGRDEPSVRRVPTSPGGSGGLANPTVAKDAAPNRSPGENLNVRRPQVRDLTDGHVLFDIPAHGNGVRWEAVCDNPTAGRASGHNGDVAGARAVGSTTAGRVDPKTGEYVGTSRAFVAGLDTSSGTLDFVSSTMQVRALPGEEPTVSYRIGVTGGTLASGMGVPVSKLTDQFDDAVRANARAIATLGQFGLTLMGPTVRTSDDSGLPVVGAPFLDLFPGASLDSGRPTHVRLVAVDFEGTHTR